MMNLTYTNCHDKLYPLAPKDITFNNNIDLKIRMLIDNLYKRVDFAKLVDYFRLKLDPYKKKSYTFLSRICFLYRVRTVKSAQLPEKHSRMELTAPIYGKESMCCLVYEHITK